MEHYCYISRRINRAVKYSTIFTNNPERSSTKEKEFFKKGISVKSLASSKIDNISSRTENALD